MEAFFQLSKPEDIEKCLLKNDRLFYSLKQSSPEEDKIAKQPKKNDYEIVVRCDDVPWLFGPTLNHATLQRSEESPDRERDVDISRLDGGKVVCRICGMDIHSEGHASMPKNRSKCHVCMTRFAKADTYLKKHMESFGDKYTCCICESTFETKKQWSDHMLEFALERNCCICNSCNIKKEDWANHVKECRKPKTPGDKRISIRRKSKK